MALQIIGIGSSANDGTGDTLRTAGNKINGNAGEIYARFGTGSADGATLEAATSANILVGNGTKFASVALSGDFEISNTGAMSVRSNEITIPSGSDPGEGNTTNKLYNVGGALFFNGNSVGTGNVTGMTQMRITGDSGGNKTVTNNEIVTIAGGTGITSVASDDQTITLNIDSTVATLTGTQTLENKTLTSPSVSGLTLSDASIVLEGSTANDFETTLTVTDPTADRTITFPDAAGTVALTSDITVTASSSTAFTNKTIDANGTGNSITNLEVADFAAASVVTQSEGIGSNDNDTTIPTSAAVKAYADSVGGGNSFTTIAVSGQNNVVADSGTDTLTLAAGSNVTITTNDSTDTVTIAASGGGSSLTVQEEGSSLSTAATTLNFVGSGVTASGTGATKTITVDNAISYAVTVASDGAGQNVYYIEGTAIKTSAHVRKVMYLQKGNIYKFDQSDASNSGHPLRFSTTPEGTHNSGSAYSDGVTVSGTPGSAGAYTQIEVKEDAPDILYIYCTNHANMGGGSAGQDAPIYTSDVGGWRLQTAARTLSAGDKIIITATSDTTVTLPAAASVGDTIEVLNNFGNDHTIARNGHKLNQNTSDATLDEDYDGLKFIYLNAATGWLVYHHNSLINTPS
tara:strand:+ start:362 stop:2254 length:1893 start_codon:yes stop_codon:yes gene_type:complete